jgi:hypothetical protein
MLRNGDREGTPSTNSSSNSTRNATNRYTKTTVNPTDRTEAACNPTNFTI